MNKAVKIAIVIVLIVVVGIVIAVKQQGKKAVSEPSATASSNTNAAAEDTLKNPQNASPNADNPTNLPQLVDLGAGKCVPCKMMAPVLEELKNDYKERLKVEFIDVWENPDEAGKYGIRVIPTQIFYDGSGKELFRHEGFFSKKDILTKWKELGFDFNSVQH